MASQHPHHQHPSLYPTVDQSAPNAILAPSSSSFYPSIPMEDLLPAPSAPPLLASREETLISIPGAILHLIDNQYSVHLACGVFSIVRLLQGDHIVAILARLAHHVQWPLIKHEPAVKLHHSRYFFSLPPQEIPDSTNDVLNYGLTFASKGQDKLLQALDTLLDMYCAFSVHTASENGVLDGSIVRDTTPEELLAQGNKEQMKERCGAYWTTLAPNVEDYSGRAAKMIAGGSGEVIKGVLWCGDVTVERLTWGNEALKKRMSSSEKAEISPNTMKRIRRAKKVTKMTQKVADGVLSGVVKVSGYFMSSLANSKAGKKFFNMLPGEILLASLDGFSKICDATEVAGKNVLSTSSDVTTDLVTHRYGEEAGQATDEGLDAAGHAFGAAWAAVKIRKALNPKNAVKASSVAKSAAKAAAADYKSKKTSK